MMEHESYVLIKNVEELVGEIQPDSIISRTFYKGDHLSAMVFGFDAGQELTEHASSHAAVIQIIQGEAVVTLGDDRYELSAGGWLAMAPHLRHSVYASTQMVMLLQMIRGE